MTGVVFQIGSYSEDEGLHLKEELNVLPTTEFPLSSPLVESGDRSTFARSISDKEYHANNVPLNAVANDAKAQDSDLDTLPIFSYDAFISRTWALVVVSVAIFGTVVTLWMIIYVFQKICDGTLNGNQVMGVLLLFSVMSLFASVIPWLLPPNETICAARHFMHPLILVVCFSILLVKSMQLRSLVTIGLGGSIPQVNQVVSLFFMVMVQVVIAAEWYLATSPIGVQLTDGYPECKVSKPRFLLLHIYPAVLLLLCFFYAVSVLKVKRNFNEGRWITCATIFIIPIFAAWPMVYYFAPVPFHDPSVAVSVVAVAGILLAAIFFPKMHTIAQQSKLKEVSDLSRSHSDATVYTGFSDYMQFYGSGASNSSGSKKDNSNAYPVYGYTTNQFVPPSWHSPSKSSKSHKSGSSSNKHKQHHRHRSRSPVKTSVGQPSFNGLNYVSPPMTTTSNNVKSYTDWSREYSPTHYPPPPHQYHQYSNYPDGRKRHNRSRSRPSQEPPSMSPTQNIYSVPMVRDSPQGRHHTRMPTTPSPLAHVSRSRPRPCARDTSTVSTGVEVSTISRPLTRSRSNSPVMMRRSRDSRSKSQVSTGASTGGGGGGYLDYEEYLMHQRLKHSQSPSDGMILTASGLTDAEPSVLADEEIMEDLVRKLETEEEHNQGTPKTGYKVSEVFLTH